MTRWAVLAALGAAAGCLGEPPERTAFDAAAPPLDAGDPCDGVEPGDCELFTCPGSRSCYRLCLPEVTFSEAIALCPGEEQVLEPETLEELQCVQAHNQVGVWMGLVQSDTAETSGEEWTWLSNGEAPAEFHWGAPEPNDGDGSESGGEQCTLVSDEDGLWADEECEQPEASVACELRR